MGMGTYGLIIIWMCILYTSLTLKTQELSESSEFTASIGPHQLGIQLNWRMDIEGPYLTRSYCQLEMNYQDFKIFEYILVWILMPVRDDTWLIFPGWIEK